MLSRNNGLVSLKPYFAPAGMDLGLELDLLCTKLLKECGRVRKDQAVVSGRALRGTLVPKMTTAGMRCCCYAPTMSMKLSAGVDEPRSDE